MTCIFPYIILLKYKANFVFDNQNKESHSQVITLHDCKQNPNKFDFNILTNVLYSHIYIKSCYPLTTVRPRLKREAPLALLFYIQNKNKNKKTENSAIKMKKCSHGYKKRRFIFRILI